ncbi:hypothetical protein [Photobacterium damselae]
MQAEENLDNAIKNYKGKYLLAVEGAIPTANNGTFLTIGNKAETGVDLIKRVTKDAAAIMRVGTCSDPLVVFKRQALTQLEQKVSVRL